MESELNLITKIARSTEDCKLNNLIRLINTDNLRESFQMLKQNKAPGIDGVSMREYEENLSSNISDLLSRMKQWSYRPQPVKRVYIPKSDGRKRPLGIPAIEDKMVQMCMTRILETIYEEEFMDNSYGFRPGRNCHQALNKIDKTIMTKPVNHVIDADIKGFFDNVSHEWLDKFLRHRIDDSQFIRLIKRFMKSGYVEAGKHYKSKQGTPQGGIISPILANVYLHYVLDLWIKKVVKKVCKGYVEIVRYADDFVIMVQKKREAHRILKSLRKRLNKFGLELSEDKTDIVEFGRYAEENARNRGEKPSTFDFLGMTHYCDKTRRGKFKVGRKTAKDKFNSKVKSMKEWLKNIRNALKVEHWWNKLCSKLVGYYRYYGMSGNYAGISRYYKAVIRLVYKWLNRRSQKRSYNWDTFITYLKRHSLPQPKIYHNFYTLSGS